MKGAQASWFVYSFLFTYENIVHCKSSIKRILDLFREVDNISDGFEKLIGCECFVILIVLKPYFM